MTAPSGVIVPSTGAVGASGATITITNGAVNPATVTIAVGQSVTFMNNDSRSHEMTSDPHPSHTNCPSLANIGTLVPGATRVSFGFGAAGSCGYHDHSNPENASLQGRIVIQ